MMDPHRRQAADVGGVHLARAAGPRAGVDGGRDHRPRAGGHRPAQLASTRGRGFAASSLGKIKMVSQVTAILLLILGQNGAQPFLWLGQVALWVVRRDGARLGARLLPGVHHGRRPRPADVERRLRTPKRGGAAVAAGVGSASANGFAASAVGGLADGVCCAVGGRCAGVGGGDGVELGRAPGRQASRRAVRAARRGAAWPSRGYSLVSNSFDEAVVVGQRLGGQASPSPATRRGSSTPRRGPVKPGRPSAAPCSRSIAPGYQRCLK